MTPYGASKYKLNDSASLMLDIVRFSAAMVVFCYHFAQPISQTGVRSWGAAGEYAVPVFFVLSGFVIRFVTLSREHSLKEYLIDRASRIYSVTIPAVVLTLVCYLLCLAINRELYNSLWGNVSNHVPIRVLVNLLFLSQAWGHGFTLLIDSPFWSLGYEIPYYVIYGLIFYLRGVRRVIAVVIWLLLFGPQVAILLSIWWLGCWIYDFYIWIRGRFLANMLRIAALLWAAVGGALWVAGRPGILWFPFSLVGTARTIELGGALHLPIGNINTRFLAVGVISGVLMFLGLLLSDWVNIPREHWLMLRVRRIADGTFSIYLLHYPLFALAIVSGTFSRDVPGRNIAVAAGICAFLIWASKPMDDLKKVMRRRLRSAFIPASKVSSSSTLTVR